MCLKHGAGCYNKHMVARYNNYSAMDDNIQPCFECYENNVVFKPCNVGGARSYQINEEKGLQISLKVRRRFQLML